MKLASWCVLVVMKVCVVPLLLLLGAAAAAVAAAVVACRAKEERAGGGPPAAGVGGAGRRMKSGEKGSNMKVRERERLLCGVGGCGAVGGGWCVCGAVGGWVGGVHYCTCDARLRHRPCRLWHSCASLRWESVLCVCVCM